MDEMVRRLERSEARRRSPARTGNDALLRRSLELSRRYLGPDAVPTSVRWVAPMRTRWASCTPVDGTIRVSERLRDVPGWVVDYVLVHELAHLLVPGHDDQFWELVRRYPRTERAIGYLEGLSAAAGLGFVGTDGDDATDSEADDEADGLDGIATIDDPGIDDPGTDDPGIDDPGIDDEGEPAAG